MAKSRGIKKPNRGTGVDLGASLATKLGPKQTPKAQVVRNVVANQNKAASGGVDRSQGGHTLLLTQEAPDKKTRSWRDFNSLEQALDGFVGVFEAELRKLNPQAQRLSYTVQDLHTYVDSLFDLSLLVLDTTTKQYAPHGKRFVKSRILARLKAAAA